MTWTLRSRRPLAHGLVRGIGTSGPCVLSSCAHAQSSICRVARTWTIGVLRDSYKDLTHLEV